ncbi:MAG: hypothetical protein IT378_27600 [Sandaracinaceae bacterium]|nr:hypothetical protein [Sandaracinaceae bacterium]
MSALNELGGSARRAIFDAMTATAWADTRLADEELLALEAVAGALELDGASLRALRSGPPSLERLSAVELTSRERRVVFACAAWLATVDAKESAGEDVVLDRLRGALALAPDEATALRDKARAVPREPPWAAHLESLIADVAGGPIPSLG